MAKKVENLVANKHRLYISIGRPIRAARLFCESCLRLSFSCQNPLNVNRRCRLGRGLSRFSGQFAKPVTEWGPALDAARAVSPVQWVLTKPQGQDLIPARFSSMQRIMNCTFSAGTADSAAKVGNSASAASTFSMMENAPRMSLHVRGNLLGSVKIVRLLIQS